MRIYKMTATFGKLNNQVLTLEPGLNVITAPNEWGKSTWCAFLLAMLYGIETRTKNKKTALADKERFAPWSGASMEGRIDLNWQGRDITIERRTKRRVPLGEFSAYETASGLPVAELTAANCGEMLLGVEQTVFRRAGFIRHSDLPVSEDEALRRRLNALVTTGDESGNADRLAESLKDLKNRCRHNRTGLLPQTEREREGLYGILEEMANLDEKGRNLQRKLADNQHLQARLENHRQALAYAAARDSQLRMEQAKQRRDQTAAALAALESSCRTLPAETEAEQKLRELKDFREQWSQAILARQMLPEEPVRPCLPAPFTGMEPEAARKMAKQEGKLYHSAAHAISPAILLILGILGVLGAGLLIYLKIYVPGGVAAGAALAALIWSFRERSFLRKQASALAKKYGNTDWKHWADPVFRYEGEAAVYDKAWQAYAAARGDLNGRWQELQKTREALCGEQTPDAMLDHWQKVLGTWEAYRAASREHSQAQNHFEALSTVVKTVAPPEMEDDLTWDLPRTLVLLEEADKEQQLLRGQWDQNRGKMEALGDRASIQKQLQKCSQRIQDLEKTYAALSIAMETLADARAELQRRFAPRISQRAQELLCRMTAGRYHSLTMGQDLSLQAGAGEEATLREGLWRSDGTVDQLYLSLRLAVAEALTPDAPLILDDALVRFDDERMTQAVAILREMAEDKQVILFTCQGREADV